ncbi:DUF983 domain-containing protein [Bradyrhizobium sp. 2TAF24]|uniref:DUF983 domain-containing protein n=1 Tax=Bradyrhizobium sp. 2TAF24 TaxID=3233011 RepID=UPI003F8E515E
MDQQLKRVRRGFAMTDPNVSLTTATLRGFAMKCPCCGKGRLFGRFLKVVDHCSACGEDYTHQRADDFPAYLVIVVVGHLIVPAILAVEVAYTPPYWLHFLIWLPLTLFSSLALLQPTKGAIVALQWHSGMHGFERARQARLARAAALQPVPVRAQLKA